MNVIFLLSNWLITHILSPWEKKSSTKIDPESIYLITKVCNADSAYKVKRIAFIFLKIFACGSPYYIQLLTIEKLPHKAVCTKVQLISKVNLEVFIWTKKWTKSFLYPCLCFKKTLTLSGPAFFGSVFESRGIWGICAEHNYCDDFSEDCFVCKISVAQNLMILETIMRFCWKSHKIRMISKIFIFWPTEMCNTSKKILRKIVILFWNNSWGHFMKNWRKNTFINIYNNKVFLFFGSDL